MLLADIVLRPEAQKLVEIHTEKPTGEPRAIYVKTDVADWKQLKRVFETADREFSAIDIVCPGAGIFEPEWSNFWHPPGTAESKDDPFGGRYAVMDINVTHPIRTTQLAISYFLSRTQGSEVATASPKRIVHISSTADQTAGLHAPMYFASKHAISGFIYSLEALEPSLGIRVNGVAPGVIKTPLWTEHPEKLKYFDSTQDQWATPEEVAEAMLACVQDDDLPGGTVLEVGLGSRRKVPLHNNPGPSAAPGLVISDFSWGTQEVFEQLAGPNWRKAIV